MKFLGTSAGEGIPDPFCTCRICENARRVGGKEMRMRSSFVLSDNVILDIGADFFAQSYLHKVPFDSFEHVFFTHTHDDHLNYMFFWERAVRRAGGDHPFNVYFSEDARGFIDDFYVPSLQTGDSRHTLKNVNITYLAFGKTYEIGGYSVTPLRGQHATPFEKNSANYLFEKDGKSLYYAVDSGYFLDETFRALEDKHLNTLIGECTFPVLTGSGGMTKTTGHMDYALCLENLDKLFKIGAIDGATDIYLTHISPYGATHKELCDAVASLDKPYRITVAYDGLTI